MNSNHRLFAYIDILGFKKMVSCKRSGEIYEILTKFVDSHSVKINRADFNLIAFSDTIIFYCKRVGYSDPLFNDLLYIAKQITIEMLNHRIPVRGVINHGEFNVVELECSANKLFWGQGMIDAYEAEPTENIVGLFILPTAHKITTEAQKELYKQKYYYKYDGRLLVNLFTDAIPGYGYTLEEDILFTGNIGALEAIKAYHFLVMESINDNNDNKTKDKYANSYRLANQLLGIDIYCQMGEIYEKISYYESKVKENNNE